MSEAEVLGITLVWARIVANKSSYLLLDALKIVHDLINGFFGNSRRRWETSWSSPSVGCFNIYVDATINTDVVVGICVVIQNCRIEVNTTFFKKVTVM